MALGPIDPSSGPADPVSAHPLQLTGERTIPGIPDENYWFRRHEVVYEWIAEYWLPESDAVNRTTGGIIVDAGSGEGYGAALLANASESAGSSVPVIGLELDPSAAEHAAERYDRLRVLRSNLDALPLATSSIDLLVSLQVVEHLWDLAGFLTECARVLGESGTAVMSTPNRLTFSPGLKRGQRPTNAFHVEEFDMTQLSGLLQTAGFADVRCYGLQHGPRIKEWERQHGSVVEAQIRAALDLDHDSPAVEASALASAMSELVESVTISDFDITERDLDDAQDLIVVGRMGAAS